MSEADDWSDAGFQYPASERYDPGEMGERYPTVTVDAGQLIYDRENGDAWVMSTHTVEISKAETTGLKYRAQVIGDE